MTDICPHFDTFGSNMIAICRNPCIGPSPSLTFSLLPVWEYRECAPVWACWCSYIGVNQYFSPRVSWLISRLSTQLQVAVSVAEIQVPAVAQKLVMLLSSKVSWMSHFSWFMGTTICPGKMFCCLRNCHCFKIYPYAFCVWLKQNDIVFITVQFLGIMFVEYCECSVFLDFRFMCPVLAL